MVSIFSFTCLLAYKVLLEFITYDLDIQPLANSGRMMSQTHKYVPFLTLGTVLGEGLFMGEVTLVGVVCKVTLVGVVCCGTESNGSCESSEVEGIEREKEKERERPK